MENSKRILIWPGSWQHRESEFHIQRFYKSLAHLIQLDFRPTSVLHVGCDADLLINALRQQGIEAYGHLFHDCVSSNVDSLAKAYYWLGSDDFLPTTTIFDLVIYSESPTDDQDSMSRILEGLIKVSNKLLLMRLAPDVILEMGARDPIVKWTQFLAHYRFFRNLDYSIPDFPGWHALYQNLSRSKVDTICEYEHSLQLQHREILSREQLSQQSIKELAERERLLLKLKGELVEREKDGLALSRKISDTEAGTLDLEQDIENLELDLAEQTDKLDVARRKNKELEAELASKLENIQVLEAENRAWKIKWADMQTGAGWMLLHRMRMGRLRVAPYGSKRDQWLKGLIASFRVLNSDGFRAGLRYVWQKLHTRLRLMVSKNGNLDENREQGQLIEITPISEHSDVAIGDVSVDIVVCVYNALDDTRTCLESVFSNTSIPFHLIIVDDASNQETQAYLRQFSEEYDASYLRNDQNVGYTFSANHGLQASDAEYVVLLNSDTIVTHGWLMRMIACARSDPSIGIVGPLSNTASWQSIPEIESNGDWAINPIPPGSTVADVGNLVERFSDRLYPEMALLNGFCLLMKQELFELARQAGGWLWRMMSMCTMRNQEAIPTMFVSQNMSGLEIH